MRLTSVPIRIGKAVGRTILAGIGEWYGLVVIAVVVMAVIAVPITILLREGNKSLAIPVADPSWIVISSGDNGCAFPVRRETAVRTVSGGSLYRETIFVDGRPSVSVVFVPQR